MALFEKRKEKKKEKRLNQLESDLNILSNRIKFDPTKIVGVTNKYDNATYFTERLQEFKILASGNRDLIKSYYTNLGDANKSDYFWCANSGNYIKVHAGIPRITCQKMMTLGTKAGINIDIQVNNEASELDEEQTKTATAVWQNIEQESKFIDAVGQMFFKDAMTGHDIVKLSYDLEASQYPIIEVYDPSEAEVIKHRGVTKEIIFKHYFNKSKARQKKLYRLDEIYSTNELNEPYIEYKLYKLQDDGNEVQIGLNAINETIWLTEETANRYIEEDELTAIQEFKGLQGMLAFDKPNKLPNVEFPHSVYGASDISATDCFGAASALIFQVTINVGMCMGVMPVIGLTLPFISYGGSSIVTLYAMLGLVSGVHARPSPTSHERYIRPPMY